MQNLVTLAAAVLLGIAATTAPRTAMAQKDDSAKSFQSELVATLERARTNKRGVVFHVQGATIAGGVRSIGPDVVVVANQQYGHVVIRLDRVDAVEAD